MKNLKITNFDSVFQKGLHSILRDSWQEQVEFLREHQQQEKGNQMLKIVAGAIEYQAGISERLPVEGLLNILKLKVFVS